jgi:hypothetical protein
MTATVMFYPFLLFLLYRLSPSIWPSKPSIFFSQEWPVFYILYLPLIQLSSSSSSIMNILLLPCMVPWRVPVLWPNSPYACNACSTLVEVQAWWFCIWNLYLKFTWSSLLKAGDGALSKRINSSCKLKWIVSLLEEKFKKHHDFWMARYFSNIQTLQETNSSLSALYNMIIYFACRIRPSKPCMI